MQVVFALFGRILIERIVLAQCGAGGAGGSTRSKAPNTSLDFIIIPYVYA